jgi:hypothetical protein
VVFQKDSREALKNISGKNHKTLRAFFLKKNLNLTCDYAIYLVFLIFSKKLLWLPGKPITTL